MLQKCQIIFLVGLSEKDAILKEIKNYVFFIYFPLPSPPRCRFEIFLQGIFSVQRFGVSALRVNDFFFFYFFADERARMRPLKPDMTSR